MPDTLTLADLGNGTQHLIYELMDTGGSDIERIADIGGHTYLVTAHRVSEHDTISDDVVLVIRDVSTMRSMDHAIRLQSSKRTPARRTFFGNLVHVDPAMTRCITLARCYVQTESAEVLYGEAGTGKEMLAKSIHAASSSGQGAFVPVNCGATPQTLIESELFGYVEGAFTRVQRGGASECSKRLSQEHQPDQDRGKKTDTPCNEK